MLPKTVMTDDVVTHLPQGGYLVIPSHILDTLSKYRQRNSSQPESGGTFIGCFRQGSDDGPISIEIVSYTEPSKMDSASRYGFVRKSKHHIQKVFNAWKRSGRDLTYLGEWHTHPENDPTPSSVDISNWEKNLKGKTAILMIFGMETDWIAFWDGSIITELPPLIPDQPI